MEPLAEAVANLAWKITECAERNPDFGKLIDMFSRESVANRRTIRLHARGRIPPRGRWKIHGLGLPDQILKKVYQQNAAHLLDISN
jgi:hypothetical protein